MIQLTVKKVIILSVVLRIGFFLFGLYQDAFLPVKYTDIDYIVFSDAAKYVIEGNSPYLRETYRYTPLLSWLMIPNNYWYHFGKLIFMICDLITGLLIIKVLKLKNVGNVPLLSSLWLLNPMVITISTRGSAESVLTVMIMAFVYNLLKNNITSSAIWLGLSIHFKLYPIIYLPTSLLLLTKSWSIKGLINMVNLKFLIVTLVTLTGFNYLFWYIYGYEFLFNTYLYHLDRLDHRHNFSIYNMVLYYKSALEGGSIGFNIENYSFIPQLGISGVLLPLLFAKKNFISCLFIQTFAFVTFNKVLTSQYFIWFLIFLPLYISSSNINKKSGLLYLVIWVLSQGLWLFSAYQLEFLGKSTFDVNLFYSSIFFFLSNCWILKNLIQDVDVVI